MKRLLSSIIISLIVSTGIYAFNWPIGPGGDPQHITSTFGEFRVPAPPGYPDNHFHDGVDIQGLDDSDGPIWGVRWEVELVWEINDEKTMLRTDYHDFAHVEGINLELEAEDSVWMWTRIADSYQSSWDHLHFNVRQHRKSAVWANNPLYPDFNTDWRFHNYCNDTEDPWIWGIFITPNTNYEEVLNYYELPPNTEVDIIVKAEEWTANPDFTDPNNGVFIVELSIDDFWEYDTIFQFDTWPVDWDIDYVYDGTRSDNSNFYYVVTNNETSDGSWNTGPADQFHDIYVRVEDEQGNSYEDWLNVYVISGSGADEKKPDKFELFVKSLNATSQATEIRYSLPKKSKVELNIYDAMGRVVNILVNKEQKAGIYTVKWNKKNKLGDFLPNGIYFCNLRAGDFETNKKIVLLGH